MALRRDGISFFNEDENSSKFRGLNPWTGAQLWFCLQGDPIYFASVLTGGVAAGHGPRSVGFMGRMISAAMRHLARNPFQYWRCGRLELSKGFWSHGGGCARGEAFFGGVTGPVTLGNGMRPVGLAMSFCSAAKE